MVEASALADTSVPVEASASSVVIQVLISVSVLVVDEASLVMVEASVVVGFSVLVETSVIVGALVLIGSFVLVIALVVVAGTSLVAEALVGTAVLVEDSVMVGALVLVTVAVDVSVLVDSSVDGVSVLGNDFVWISSLSIVFSVSIEVLTTSSVFAKTCILDVKTALVERLWSAAASKMGKLTLIIIQW